MEYMRRVAPQQTFIMSLLIIACIGLATATTDASLVGNGDFEVPDATIGPTYSAGETFGGWTVDYGNINHVGSSFWQAASGNQSVDLTGQFEGPGAIYQDLSTAAGQTYLLSFAMAGNPYGDPAVKMMEIWWDSALIDTLAFDTTGYSGSHMGWVYHGYSVVASDSITRLEFASLTDGYYGPALDDVSVAPVPIPAAVLLGMLGLGTAGWRLRKCT